MTIIGKEEVEKIKSIEGKVRGASLKADGGYILKEFGEDGLKKLEKAMSDLGYNIKYEELATMDYYPIAIKALTLLSVQKLFNFKKKDFIKMGMFGSKVSLILKLFVKYFFSFDRVMKEIPKVWRKYYNVGDLKVIEYDKKKGYVVGRLENFDLHPLECQYLTGYFPSVMKMIVKEKITCQETKCIHKGDEYHEFLLKW